MKSETFLRQLAWEETLAETVGCYADEVGNRPCDNGCMCDKCSADWVHEVYINKLETLKNN